MWGPATPAQTSDRLAGRRLAGALLGRQDDCGVLTPTSSLASGDLVEAEQFCQARAFLRFWSSASRNSSVVR